MEVTVVVEIPKGCRSKFEIDPATGTIWLDRILATSTQYPAEYGYIPDTAAEDGDPLDAIVLVEEQTVPGCHVRARPIGLLSMADEMGPDPKVLCVALGDPSVGGFHDIVDISQHLTEEIEHFFRVYKQLEPHKSVTVTGWQHADEAERLILACRQRAIINTLNERNTMQLELSESDLELLRDILDSEYRDLKYEIADTDNSTFKASLTERERRLSSLLDQVGGPLPDRA